MGVATLFAVILIAFAVSEGEGRSRNQDSSSSSPAPMIGRIMEMGMMGMEFATRFKALKQCGNEGECEGVFVRCHRAVLGMRGKEEGCSGELMETNELVKDCVNELELKTAFDEFNNAVGQYLAFPYIAFKAKLMISGGDMFMKVACCTYRKKGIVNEDDTPNIEKMIEAISTHASNDAKAVEAIKGGVQLCQSKADQCNVMPIKECLLEQCLSKLSEGL